MRCARPCLLAVLAGVIRLAEGNPYARRRDQEAHREAVAVLHRVLGLAIATPFARPPLPVAGAEGVFRLLACLTGQRGVDDEDKQAVGGLSLQQFLPQDRVDIEFPPPWPRQEAADLSPMPSLATYSPGRPQAGHPAGVQQERDDHADHQELGAVLQSERRDPPLETRYRIGDHDHGEAPSSAGEISMIRPLQESRHFRQYQAPGERGKIAQHQNVRERGDWPWPATPRSRVGIITANSYSCHTVSHGR